MKHKLFTFFLTLIASVSAIYASDTQVDGIWYNFDNDTQTASVTYRGYSAASYDDEYSGLVIIPETVTYNGTTYSVTSIESYAFGLCSSLTSVTIPNSVTSIESYAFSGCSSLTKTNYTGDVAGWCNINFGGVYANPMFYSHNFYINDQEIKDLVIPNSVTSIGNRAFSGCSSLTSVTIGESVTSIGNSAFSGCSSLASVTIGNSVTSIGNYAFENCSSLTSVTIGNSVTSIGNHAFYGCSSLTSVTIPNSVTSIGDYAFRNCSSLTSVTIGNSVTSIGNYAFENCSSLTKTNYTGDIAGWCNINFGGVYANPMFYSHNFYINDQEIKDLVIPNSVTSIGQYTFAYCSSLTSVTIPNSVTSIGNGAFLRCSFIKDNFKNQSTLDGEANNYWGAHIADVEINGLLIRNDTVVGCRPSVTMVIFPDYITCIGEFAFYNCSSLTSVTIPNSVTSIERYAFSGCSSLTSVTIGNSVTSIGDYAFRNCSSLASVTIPNSVTSIGNYAFSDCSSLTSVTIGNSVTSIGGYAFSECSSLTSVTIPNSVTSIGGRVFSGCSSLTSVTIGESVTNIGGYAFYGCSSLTSVTIPNSVTSIGNYAFSECSSLTSVTINSNAIVSKDYSYNDNISYIFDSQVTEYIIGDDVKKIGSYAFCVCSSLTSITIPNSVTSIGNRAFRGCSSLTSVTIPNSVTSIGNYAFENCSSLTSVTIPNSVTSIGNYAFENCSSLTKTNYTGDVAGWCNINFGDGKANPMCHSHNFYINDQEIKDLVIPNSVTSIGNYAFFWCSSLTSVTIPNSVTNIGEEAFRGCSSLTSVTIPNSVTSIGGGAFSSCSSLASVSIPNSVTSIGEWAFGECTFTKDNFTNYSTLDAEANDYWGATVVVGNEINGLIIRNDTVIDCRETVTSVEIPNSVTSIGSGAFYDCSSLTSVTIPNSVTSIGEWAFFGCFSLTKTNYTGDIAGWCNINFGDIFANPMCHSHNFYINDQEIKDLIIPNTVDSIHSYAFASCSSLTSVTIPNSVTSIGSCAFYECSSLTSVTIPNSVKSIGDDAFSWCSSLTSITCEAENPPTVGSDAFYNVSKSIPVYVPCGCVGAYKAKSGWEDFTNIQEPLAEYSIEVDVNDNIMGTAKVDINSACGNQISATPNFGYHLVQWSDGNTDNPRSLVLTQDTILTAEFALTQSGQCGDNLYWELIDDTLHITGSGEMYDYISDTAPWKRSIKALCIGESVTSIGDYAFYSCTSLTSVTIPNSVTSIGSSVFENCSSLTSVTIPNSVTSIGSSVFRNCSSLTSVTIGNSVTSIGSSVFENCSSLTSVTIGESVTSISSWAFWKCSSLTSVTINSNAIVSKDYSYDDNISDIFGSQVTEYIIGDDVKGIGRSAFYDCSSLTSVTIGESVTSIGEEAFYGCSSLTSMTIPNSVTSIGSSAFRGCSSLTSVTIGESVTSIGEEAFYGCSSLTSVTIGESVTSIGDYAFSSCSGLTSVTIPNSVTSIGGFAFEDCSSLTAIICEAATPPNLGRSSTSSSWYNSSLTFQGVSKSIPVYVPCGCVEAYKTANGWKDFTNIQEPLAYSIEVNVNDTVMGTAKVDYNTFCEGNQISATPNFGYHFVQWSDGNTDAIRTLELTQDTILTAEFAQSFSGQCGDNLYWSYDETTKTVSITGSGKMYDYTADTQPWLLFKNQLVEVTTSNTVTSIGTSAFEGCIRLSKISLGTGLEEIAANAFAGCTRLYDIYVYATYPPFAEESSFANYNVYVYIPCEYQRDYTLDVVWGKFKFIECIDSEEATTDGNVTIVPGYNDVTITWPTEDNADNYAIVIEKDGEVFCTLTFNADGQLLNIAFAPARNGDNRPVQYAEQAVSGYRFTVTGLTEATRYAYNVTTKDAANKTIATYSGEFTTKGGITTAVEDILHSTTNCQKLLRDGQLIIIRDGKTYNVMGKAL